MTTQWMALLGGLALFLLGMNMLSEGLKLAAGKALEMILTQATRTRWRGLLSGAVMTILVQSSSAVTVATIGFINASLLTLSGAIWVLFGANLGTTATGWLVAVAGLKFDLSVVALPMIAVGVAMKLAGTGQRLSAYGDALTGFGLLFYGIALMQLGFAEMSSQWQIPQGEGAAAIIMQLLAGVLMTAVMQSSSASIAIALTAAQTGLIDLNGAAAVVIGANIGTTLTAVLASIGATPNARRVASAHILFNTLTAAATLLIMPWLLSAIVVSREVLDLGESAAMTLAIFNTIFNALGILLMWPLASAMTRFLERLFVTDTDKGVKPEFLDSTSLPVPRMAAQALAFELERMLTMAWQYVGGSFEKTVFDTGMDSKPKHNQTQSQGKSINMATNAKLRRDLFILLKASEHFIDQMNRNTMDERTGLRLARLLRVRRYLENSVDNISEAFTLSADIFTDPHLTYDYFQYVQSSSQLAEQRTTVDANSEEARKAVKGFEDAYQLLKQSLLAAGAAGHCRVESMEIGLRRISVQRRALQQLVKAHTWMALVDVVQPDEKKEENKTTENTSF
jgi:phosphate:Na+ symporter